MAPRAEREHCLSAGALLLNLHTPRMAGRQCTRPRCFASLATLLNPPPRPPPRPAPLLQAFERMRAQGCRADGIVYNAIIDTLWETGVVWAQRRALALFRCVPMWGWGRYA